MQYQRGFFRPLIGLVCHKYVLVHKAYPTKVSQLACTLLVQRKLVAKQGAKFAVPKVMVLILDLGHRSVSGIHYRGPASQARSGKHFTKPDTRTLSNLFIANKNKGSKNKDVSNLPNAKKNKSSKHKQLSY